MKKKYYSIIHCHTDYSNGITNIDSVTKYDEYIDFVAKNKKKLGINNLCFTEHGSLFEWYKKKTHIEEMGMKYIHSIEIYVTETLENKQRDNYHVCLFAKNFEGFKELNKLASKAFDRNDGHFYYNPRVTLDDLMKTSDNIMMSTACLGGILNKCKNNKKEEFINFLTKNKHRCYLEIQHHNVESQINYNKYLYNLHIETGIPLIVGTDTHALNETHLKGRSILQKAKNIFFDDEDGWDLSLKTHDELIECFKIQNVIPMKVIEEALENTNRLFDQVEEFTIDREYKYPKLYENPEEVLMNKIKKGIVEKGINKYPNYKTEYLPRITYELDTYKHNKAFDFLLLDEDIKSYARMNNMYPGYSRGSVSGSLIAYIIGMTDIDSIKHNMNFERFMNKERVSLADVDTDYEPKHREKIKSYIYAKEGLYCADIITFNTVALKGSIRDVCRALYKKEPSKKLVETMDKEVEGYGVISDSSRKQYDDEVVKDYMEIANYICDNVETNEQKMREEYPKVFEYVDIINGTIVSIGIHPCGLVVSPIPLDENMGLCSISGCDNPVTMISMKSIDAQNYVKLDILGLDNIQIINETCEMAGIERLTPDNVPDEEVVWKSMAEDNTLIFQWESDSAGDFLNRLLSDETIRRIKVVNPDFKYKDLVSMGNGAIRPAGSSYREALSNGEFRDNGHEALNEFLAPTMGYLVYQEQIIFFLNQFCGFTMGEADVVRRGFAKKTGTEQFTPIIINGGYLDENKKEHYIKGFIQIMKEKYDIEKEEAEKLIVNFIKIIEDASSYLFSLNHAEPYTYVGYIGGYLRYYYPLEYLTSGLNVNQGKIEKTNEIIKYCEKRGITINPPKFRFSKAEYMFDKDSNSIYKGIASIKFLNEKVSNELYDLRDIEFNSFTELIRKVMLETSINFKQLKILVKLNYFSEFGKNKKLFTIVENYESRLKNKSLKEKTVNTRMSELIEAERMVEDKTFDIKTQIEAETEYVGAPVIKKDTLPDNVYSVIEIKNQYLKLYRIKTGEVFDYRVKKTDLVKNDAFGLFNIIKVTGIKKQNKRKKNGDDWITLKDEFNIYISSWNILL